ncbi:MAG: hypothetical protein HZC26_03955, partial [Candidatus Magasanikbacteria bacterium]|nr:hypothetical protein [Candidatus Magasanikbacteria bacterium]
MPVKKSKKPKKEKISKKEVKEAVEKLPGLIVEQVRLSEPEPQKEAAEIEQAPEPIQTRPETPRSNNRTRLRHDPRQTRWLWTGVVIFCLVIFSMWGWNMYVMITDATQGNGSDKGWLPDPVKDDLRTVWQEVGAPDNESDGNETIKEKIKTDIKSLITQVKNLPDAITTSTTASSTESAAVS